MIGPVPRDQLGDREWIASIERFAGWLAEVSPFYRELRSDVLVHPDAPARLGEFWRIVGWAPGVGLTWPYDPTPQRPERHLGRAMAERMFRRWLNAECLAPTLKLPEPTVAALWDRLPSRCWVHYTTVKLPLRAHHGGCVYFVDEDAGDDPPLMVWDTTKVRHARPLAVEPEPLASSAVAELVRRTVENLFSQRMAKAALPAPVEPGLFAPAYPYLWELGPRVWGKADTGQTGNPGVISTLLCRSPRAYLDYLLTLPAERLSGHSGDGFWVNSAHLLMVEDAKKLAPQRLVEQGGQFLPRQGRCWSAVGRVDGVPIKVTRCSNKPNGDEIVVAPEDYAALRQIMKREKIRAYQHFRPRREATASEPTTAERALAARLAAQAADQPSPKPRRPRRPQVRPAVAVTVDPTAESAVRELGALMRQRLLAALPGIELIPPTFTDDEPPLLRALWEELGHSDELAELVGWPDRVSSDGALARVLDDYRSWESPLTRRELPRTCRLLVADEQGCGLIVTDESVPCADPPVLGFYADTAEGKRLNPSYVAWVVEQLAYLASENGEVYCVLESDPPLLTASGDPGEPASIRLPRRLSPTVWADPVPDDDGRWCRVGARRLADVIDWLAQTDTIDRFALREQPRPAAWLRLTSFAPTEQLRICDAPAGPGRYHVGIIDGIPILISAAEDQAILYTTPEDGKRAELLAIARGWVAC